MNALNLLCAQLTRDLAKFFFVFSRYAFSQNAAFSISYCFQRIGIGCLRRHFYCACAMSIESDVLPPISLLYHTPFPVIKHKFYLHL